MGIQPIDLQTIYTQMDKISKSTVAQQQGAQLARAMQQEETQKQELLRSESVRELRADNESIAAVDDKGGGSEQYGSRNKREQRDGTPAEEKREFFSEAYLGHNIDVSG